MKRPSQKYRNLVQCKVTDDDLNKLLIFGEMRNIKTVSDTIRYLINTIR